MSPGESGQQPAEDPEVQGLMASANPEEGEDDSAPEPKVRTCKGSFPDGPREFCSFNINNRVHFLLFVLQVAWNGSVSHNWANRITTYRDTIIEDSPALINGALNIFITAAGMVNAQTSRSDLFCLLWISSKKCLHTSLLLQTTPNHSKTNKMSHNKESVCQKLVA